MTQGTRLRLRAEDAEDLTVIAAFLQEAVGCVGEMAYDKEAKRFALILVRFAWEEAPAHPLHAPGGGPAQVKTGLHFDTVSAVKTRGIDRQVGRQMLNLITITSEPARDPKCVNLLFVGAEVRLEVERLSCHVQDLEDPYRPAIRPAGDLRQAG